MAPPPPKELPGFYYDPDKNRYFPIRGLIPGAATRRPAPPPPPAEPPVPQAAAAGCSKRARQPELLHAREMYGGGVIFSNKRKSTFMRQCQYAQASQPMVWKYKGTALVADKALEELYATIQTPNGLKESKVLVTGSMNGTVRLYGLGTAIVNFEAEMEFLPEPAWTPLVKQKASMNSALASIWSAETAFSNFSSSVTCIKRLQHHFPGVGNFNSSSQRALVATLGSGESGGSIYIMDLSDTIELAMGSFNAYRGNIIQVASFNRTIWTADCNSDGTQAVIGTNSGAAFFDLERRALSWMYHCKSDILSQQFMQSGNVVLCGLRNGSIFPLDVRQRQHNSPTELSSPGTARRTVPLTPRRHNRWRNQADNTKSSRAVAMSSAVCSLVVLSSDEHYFLGSSMDGSIKLFDLRLIQKGPIQSYAGHVNSHTHLPLVVDPSETLLLSGGEDCTVRIWSIKTGEQIFAQSVAGSLFTAFCWPESGRDLHNSSMFGLNHSWGAWMGSRDGLFYMHGT
ncbi:DDB1- and CUL4-associated factor 4 [Oryza brachyantha]|uniref:Uncharacterized protein n=1 Tax=Oryza brachyantha TaxID=4533 RepID=J3MI25_ORYBR|nr:DDB1- and CUL4-associated factor 4 [Oryza brachyantha]